MKIVDRNGSRIDVEDKQDKLLNVVYKVLPLRMIMKLVTKPWVSKLGGMVLESGWSTCLIEPFVKSKKINMDEYEEQIYTSYNDFFTRKIRKEMRPFTDELNGMMSPCDCKVSAFPITEKGIFKIKNSSYTVASLLRNRKLAKHYEGGTALILRLCVDDYHRYCYLADCKQGPMHRIEGSLHTVNPHALEHVPVYKENTREYCILNTKQFGHVLQMEVGALMVGKICNYDQNGTVHKRGEEKGRFEFGGSTIVLLVEKEKVRVLDKFIQNTKEGYETCVKMGELIARKK